MISSSQRPNIFLLNRRSVLVFYLLRPIEPDNSSESWRKGPLGHAFLSNTFTPPPESTCVYRRQLWSEMPDKEVHFVFRLEWVWHEN